MHNFYLFGISIDWALVLSGLVVGCLVGLTGVGGGSLMTPILVFLFKIHPAAAVGTDLLYASITKLFGTAAHGHEKNVNWRIVGLLALGSVPAALLTLFLVKSIGHTEAFSKLIKTILGYALAFTAITVIFRSHIFKFAQNKSHLSATAQTNLTVLTGVLLGFMVALTSVGAGAIGVTALVLLYPQLKTVEIVGTDIAHAVPLTLAAGIGYFLIGDVRIPMLVSLLMGSIPGILIGSYFAPKIPEKYLRFVLAAVLLLVSYKTLFPK